MRISRAEAFPSSAAFDAINSSLQSDEPERKDAVKKGNAVFAFTLKNQEGKTETWHIDLKEKGEVVKGVPEKADGELRSPLPVCSRSFTPQTRRPTFNRQAECKSVLNMLTRLVNSQSITLGRRLWQDGLRQDTSTATFHGWEAEDQGRCHEGDEDGAGAEAGADEGEAVE